jgi:hypothetical protein
MEYIKRIEYELKDGYFDEELIQFGKKGLLVLAQKKGVENGNKTWRLVHLDNLLEQQNATNIVLGKRFFKDEICSSDSKLHLFFLDKKGKYELITYDIDNDEIIQMPGAIPKKAHVKEMEVLGEYCYFQASIKNAPYVFAVNWTNGRQTNIPLFIPDYKPKQSVLEKLQLLEGKNEVLAYIKGIKKKKESEQFIVVMNEYGEKESTLNFSKNFEHNLVDLSCTKLDNTRYTVSGTYSSKSTYAAEGLFFGIVEGEEFEFIKTYNFLDLKNFLDYLPQKRKEKLEKKKKKKNSKGKEFKLSYRIAEHEVIQVEDGYVFLGEAFYPTYRTETYTTTSAGPNGQTITTTHTRTVFDGYQYTHAVVAKFQLDGSLEWDECFELSPGYKPFYVKRFISVQKHGTDAIKMVYASQAKIYSKVVDFDGEILQKSESEKIKPMKEGDITKVSQTNLDYWYDDYFISYGAQKIKNKSAEVKKRKVYYLVKIRYD